MSKLFLNNIVYQDTKCTISVTTNFNKRNKKIFNPEDVTIVLNERIFKYKSVFDEIS